MNRFYGLVLAASALCLFTSTGSGQVAKPEPTKSAVVAAVDPTIEITNESGQKTTVGNVNIAKLARVTVKASDHGTETTFEGVSLVEVLKLAGVEFGDKLRGKRLASFLLVEAADKYQVVFSLAELDPGFTNNVFILADKRDGKPLPDNAREWQIVAPNEKKAGRWVRQVVRMRVMSVGER